MAYGSSQYGSLHQYGDGARSLIAADILAPSTILSGTATRTRSGSGTLALTKALSGTSTRARTGSGTLALTLYAATWTLEQSLSGYRTRDGYATLILDVAPVAPPAGAAEVYIKKVTRVYPAPTLDQFGRPK